MLLVFTGNGKGKTTAALGQALRVVGDGKKAVVLQFIKGPFKSGEDFVWKRLYPDLEIIKGGLGFVGILGDKLPFSEHKKAAEKTWNLAKSFISKDRYDFIVLDEINNALHLGLLNEDEVRFFLDKNKDSKDVICTGRDAPEWLIDLSDLATNMQEIKHPFNKGKQAQKGIEF